MLIFMFTHRQTKDNHSLFYDSGSSLVEKSVISSIVKFLAPSLKFFFRGLGFEIQFEETIGMVDIIASS